MQTNPPTGYLIHLVRGAFQLDIPGEWEMPCFLTFQGAVDAAWAHHRANPTPSACEAVAGHGEAAR